MEGNKRKQKEIEGNAREWKEMKEIKGNGRKWKEGEENERK